MKDKKDLKIGQKFRCLPMLTSQPRSTIEYMITEIFKTSVYYEEPYPKEIQTFILSTLPKNSKCPPMFLEGIGKMLNSATGKEEMLHTVDLVFFEEIK